MNEELIEKVRTWSIERGLDTADPTKQRLKLWEEFGELNAAIARNSREDAIDAIGDMLVVMIIYCQQSNCYLNELFEPYEVNTARWNEIEIYKMIDFAGMGIFKTRESIYAIKDIATNLSGVAYKLNTSLERCLQSAYNEIKDRRGEMINGVFVKESDLK